MMRWLSIFLAAGLTPAGAVALQVQDEFFPNTKEWGRAAIQYKDDEIQVVAAYYYSQRNHDSRWILIEAAVATERGMKIHRDTIKLITPEGRELTLATQRRFARDIRRVRPLVQNTTTSRHGIGSYFKGRRQSEPMRFYAFPGDPVVYDEFVVDQHRVVWGDLFFESPTGLWDPGTYTLVIQHEDVRAEVPIELE